MQSTEKAGRMAFDQFPNVTSPARRNLQKQRLVQLR
jgi:hypothetical protein